jgi:hypothetical protein
MLMENDYAEKVADLIAKMKALGIENVKSFQDAILLVPKVVKLVEEEQWILEAEDKKALAVEVINQLVDIPFLPEALEAQVFGVMIDVAVIVLNELIGKNWLEKVR